MKISFALLAIFGTAVLCKGGDDGGDDGGDEDVGEFKPPTATDLRSPCPMVNALANHGFLARDGVNVSLAQLITGFNASVNLAADATTLVGTKALTASTTGNAATFNLDDIDTHGIIEHDGSLSRNDIFFGDNHSFNATRFSEITAFFTGPTISKQTAATAHTFALTSAAKINPNFSMSVSDMTFSFIESSLYLSVFDDKTGAGEAVTSWVEYLFTKERLPYALGWTRPSSPITTIGVLGLVAELAVLSVV